MYRWPHCLQEILPDAALHLERVGEREPELDDAVIQVRHARLHAKRHQAAIHLHQQLVRQRRDQVVVLRSLQVAPGGRCVLPGVQLGLAKTVGYRLEAR